MLTQKEIEKTSAIAFYQTTWGRYYFLKHEILKIKATLSQHENTIKDYDNVEKVKDLISEMFYLKFLCRELMQEFEQLEIVLNAKQRLREPEKQSA